MKNLAHSASFHAGEKIAPSNPGIKHLAAFFRLCSPTFIEVRPNPAYLVGHVVGQAD
jgi:hypothetical protein